jgi:large subunit ribosomal protein L17
MLKSLVSGVLWYGAIETTHARAKVAQPLLEEMVTLARGGGVEDRRRAARLLSTGSGAAHTGRGWRAPAGRLLVKRLFDEIGPRYKDRNGGYSRVVRIGRRRGDASEMVRLELVDFPART